MEILVLFVKVAHLLANTMAPFFINTAILLRDRTLSMQEGSRGVFVVVIKYFRHILMGHEIFFKIFSKFLVGHKIFPMFYFRNFIS